MECRHIKLPFDFRDGSHRPTDKEAADLLWGLFPGTELISYDDLFVYLTMPTLPSKPWPKTIGGIPVRFDLRTGPPRTPNRPRFFRKGQPVSVRNGRVTNDKNWRELDDWSVLFHAVEDHFMSIGVSITEVINWGCMATVVLEHRETDMFKVPATIGQMRCYYVFEDQMGRGAHGQRGHSHHQDLQPRARQPSGSRSDENEKRPYKIGEIVYLDSPEHGCLDGSLKAESWRRVTSDNASRQRWILTTWIYGGQESACQLSDIVYGSPIYRENGDIVGFVQYAPNGGVMEDWCSAIVAGGQVRKGYWPRL